MWWEEGKYSGKLLLKMGGKVNVRYGRRGERSLQRRSFPVSTHVCRAHSGISE